MNSSDCSQLLTHEEIIKNQIKLTKIKNLMYSGLDSTCTDWAWWLTHTTCYWDIFIL